MFDQNWLKRYMLSNNPTKPGADRGDRYDGGGDDGFQDSARGRGGPLSSKAPSEAGMDLGADGRSRLDNALGERAWAPTGGYLAEQPRQGRPVSGADATFATIGGCQQRASSSTAVPPLGNGGMPLPPPGGFTTPGRGPIPGGRTASARSGAGAALAACDGGQQLGGLGNSNGMMGSAYGGAGGCSARNASCSGGIAQATSARGAIGMQGAPMPAAAGSFGGGMQGAPLGSGSGGCGLFGQQNLFASASPFDSGGMLNMWGGGGGGGFGQKDAGPRYYVVMCKDDVEVRASPTYADDTRIGHFLHPGQVVVVDERRMVTGSFFLHLADGRGWVFETKERLLVMTEAKEFERGLWHYSVVCDDDVETRLAPTYSDDMRTGSILASGDCIAVDERCVVASARFLKLADGRGWVFETKDRLCVMSEVRAKSQEARDFARGLWHYTVVCDDDVEIRAAPTYSDEARTGLMVHPGDCVAVDERCRVAAVWFLRLADGRGWVFETKDSRRVMMQLH